MVKSIQAIEIMLVFLPVGRAVMIGAVDAICNASGRHMTF